MLTCKWNKAGQLAEAHIECRHIFGHAKLVTNKHKKPQIVTISLLCNEDVVWQLVVAQPLGEPVNAANLRQHLLLIILGGENKAESLCGRILSQAISITARQLLKINVVNVQVLWQIEQMEMQVIDRGESPGTVVAHTHGRIINVPHEIDAETEGRCRDTLHQVSFNIRTADCMIFGQWTLVDDHLYLDLVFGIIYGQYHLQIVDFVEVKVIWLECGSHALNRLRCASFQRAIRIQL